MKIFIILRDPIERAYSHWNMEIKRSADNASFSEAIRKERQRCREALPLQHRVYSYVDRGFYVEQLRRLWFYFPRRQTMIIKNRDLRRKPANILKRVAMFLNISDFAHCEQRDVHSTPYSSSLDYEDWVYLKEIYEFEILQLERILDWDCSEWLSWQPS